MKGMYLLALLLLFVTGLSAQHEGFYPEQDTVEEIEADYVPKIKTKMFAGRPGRAALYSLILPGAGQAYNKKYWQVPIVWAGVGTAGYFMYDNTKEYNRFKEAYKNSILGEPVDPEIAFLTTDQLRVYRDKWNEYRQISIFVFAATWIANSAHAFVSAHLKDFDISDDLSMQVLPFTQPDPITGALPVSGSIVLRF
jgi:hypothetical protein